MLWETLLDAKILELLRAGATEAARERALEIVESFC
jgi:hypothetical protein